MSVHLGQVRADSPWLSPLEDNYASKIDQKFSEEIYLFSFVRNPYARVFSSYRNKILGVAKGVDNFDYLQQIRWQKQNPPSFDEFLHVISDQDPYERNEHWRTMTDLLCLSEVSYDKIYKGENFAENISELTKKIFPSSLRSIRGEAHVNATHSGNFRQSAYAPASIKMVQDIYKKDFENFGYSLDFEMTGGAHM
ncbi:sulfotransferase family 2 domain-containing protein [Methylorubrum extorquens]